MTPDDDLICAINRLAITAVGEEVVAGGWAEAIS